MDNPWSREAGTAVFGAVSLLVILAGTIATLTYFFFSVEHKGAPGKVSQVGIFFLMVSFGAAYGFTVMGRVSLLIGQVQFLIEVWLRIST